MDIEPDLWDGAGIAALLPRTEFFTSSAKLKITKNSKENRRPFGQVEVRNPARRGGHVTKLPGILKPIPNTQLKIVGGTKLSFDSK